MATLEKKSLLDETKDFISEYENIVPENDNTTRREWSRSGDVFELLSLFDYNYQMLPSLGSIGRTTLISDCRHA